MNTKTRPKRPRIRTDDIHIRVPPAQKKKIELLAKSCGLTVTQLVCVALLDGIVPVISRADPALLRHMASVGNLLNQVAVACNYSNAEGKAIDLALVHLQLEQIKVRIDAYAPTIP